MWLESVGMVQMNIKTIKRQLVLEQVQGNHKLLEVYKQEKENVDEIIHRLYGGTIASSNPKVRKSVILRRGYYQTIKIALNERADGKI